MKISFGVGLLGTYFGGTGGSVAPIVNRWIATAVADQPQLYGGALCDTSDHDSATSTMRQDLAYRSPGCYAQRMTPPSLWAQAFDDELFPAPHRRHQLGRRRGWRTDGIPAPAKTSRSPLFTPSRPTVSPCDS